MTTILVVDDSPTMLSGTSKILASAGYDVIQAESGESGIKMAATDNPDLILMDVVMPDLNGFQETDKVWAQRQGASDYVVKPPNTKE